ncbi:RBR-type E3 ubiquitin transferase [Melia azedarach]|uniref:RBR-type E3 ubiquitin transferase n=1 Tax=Melia azedarach TaxID=155640 RepID=A0ACC1YKG4_MELAZ|nr:RBR-type E3 ubiquitin transferase [Melia azedarach]
MGNSLRKPSETLEDSTQKDEENNESSFTCEICIEPTATNNKFKNKNLCTHPFCQDCIAKYIEAKIQFNNTARIQCPGLHCEQILDPIPCKPLIPENLFTRWCDLLCDDYVLGLERSYCPNRNCGALVVNECERNGEVKKAQCPNCKQWFCFQCKSIWHAGYRCEESENLRDSNDIRFGNLVEKMSWARCPSCGHCVEKKDGCFIMTCRCKTKFCYICGGMLPSQCVCNPKRGGCFALLVLIVMMVVCIWIAATVE